MIRYSIFCFLLFTACQPQEKPVSANTPITSPIEINNEKELQLRHIVLFKFKDSATKDDIRKVEKSFAELPANIEEIRDFEWGINNSPEGLDKGFTHCFQLTFDSEEDRAIYLPHPDHKAFGDVLGPFLDDVLVIDYWTNE